MPRKTTRRHAQGDESRQRILEATLELAAERGYEGTTVGLVTERTGLPASSVYWHFKNKDELLAETLEFSFRQWRSISHTWEERDPLPDLGDEVRTRMQAAGRSILDSPEFWRLGLMLGLERRVKEPAARRRYVEVREETSQAVEAWWKQVLPPEVLAGREDEPRQLARLHLAMMDGLFLGMRINPEWDLESLIGLVAQGLTERVRVLAEAAR